MCHAGLGIGCRATAGRLGWLGTCLRELGCFLPPSCRHWPADSPHCRTRPSRRRLPEAYYRSRPTQPDPCRGQRIACAATMVPAQLPEHRSLFMFVLPDIMLAHRAHPDPHVLFPHHHYPRGAERAGRGGCGVARDTLQSEPPRPISRDAAVFRETGQPNLAGASITTTEDRRQILIVV